MTTLVINDLVESKELDRNAMASVYGGAGLFDLTNNVADFDFAQLLDVNTTASNQSFINAFQANSNGNGLQFAPQFIFVTQDADATTDDVANTDANVG